MPGEKSLSYICMSLALKESVHLHSLVIEDLKQG